MLLMSEDLARARMRDLQDEAFASSRARRVVVARRAQRRADRAMVRASRAAGAVR